MNIERREFDRYQVRLHTIFLYSNNSPVKGWVKDISIDGMSFEYTPTEECELQPEISLILTGDAFPFYLSDIPCKTIYDIKVDKNDPSVGGPETRRCGVQYQKLDPEMERKLTSLFKSEVVM